MSQRNIGIEYLRVFASLAVIVIHVSALAIRQTVGYSYEIGMVFDAFSRFAVPVFFMISGYLMIQPQKEITFKQIFRKTWQRIIVPLLFWLIIYLALSVGWYVVQFDLSAPQAIFERLLSGETLYHFWFLPVLACYYLATPFFVQMVKKYSSRFISLFILGSFVLGLIMQFMTSWNSNLIFILLELLGFTGYYLFGYLIRNQQWRLSFVKGFSGYFLCSLITLINLYCFYQVLEPDRTISTITDNFFPTIILASLFLFSSMIHREFTPNWLTKVVLWLSPYTFGIYLVHVAVLTVLSNFGELTQIPMISNTLILIIGVFGFSLLIVYFMRKAPYLRRFT